jgi:K+-sensing histidine kinase KdpD
VLDFARGRLGSGLILNLDTDEPLEPVLNQVVAELRASWPDRAIEVQFALADPVNCDRTRVGQLFSNLLANAVTHGAVEAPIRVLASTDEGAFHLSVSNAGEPIPPAAEHLFHPFFRGAAMAEPWADTATSTGRLMTVKQIVDAGGQRGAAHVLPARLRPAPAFRRTGADQVALYGNSPTRRRWRPGNGGQRARPAPNSRALRRRQEHDSRSTA